MLPGLIIVGLICIPYVDKNPKGNGYYTFNGAEGGDHDLSVRVRGAVGSLIVLGTFLRGPNWNFFGPFEFWDIHKLAALTNVNLAEYIWVRGLRTGLPAQWFIREIFGIVFVLFYVFALPVLLAKLWLQDRTSRSSARRATTWRVPVSDDDVAAAQDAGALAVQPEIHRGHS